MQTRPSPFRMTPYMLQCFQRHLAQQKEIALKELDRLSGELKLLDLKKQELNRQIAITYEGTDGEGI